MAPALPKILYTTLTTLAPDTPLHSTPVPLPMLHLYPSMSSPLLIPLHSYPSRTHNICVEFSQSAHRPGSTWIQPCCLPRQSVLELVRTYPSSISTASTDEQASILPYQLNTQTKPQLLNYSSWSGLQQPNFLSIINTDRLSTPLLDPGRPIRTCHRSHTYIEHQSIIDRRVPVSRLSSPCIDCSKV